MVGAHQQQRHPVHALPTRHATKLLWFYKWVYSMVV